MALLAHPAAAGSPKFHRYPDRIANKYIVVLADDYKSRAAELALSLSASHQGKAIGVFDHVLGGFAVEMPEALAIKLSEDSRVEAVHESVRMRLTGSGTQSDPNISWGLDRIDETYLADMDDSYVWHYSGVGVIVYVLDTGINEVADLAGRIDAHMLCWSENTVCETSWLGPTYGRYDYDNHGTPVASIAGGVTHGVAKDVRFKDVQVWSSSSTLQPESQDLVKALNWTVADHNARGGSSVALSVANISMDFGDIYPAIDEAIRDALTAGVTVVVGAGNQGADACNSSPARTGNPASIPDNPNSYSAITVAASNEADAYVSLANATWTSNFGPCVDIFAPGHNVQALHDGGGAGSFEGTSASSPHVAGLAAIRMENYGALSPSSVEGSIKDMATANVLTGVPADTPNLLLYTLTTRRRACCSQ